LGLGGQSRLAALAVLASWLGEACTMSSSIRTEATLEQHRNHITGVKVAHAEQQAAAKSPRKEAWHQKGNNEPDLVATTLTPLSTTQLEQQLNAPKATMDAVEKRKNMAILERMQTKLDFVRSPRFEEKDAASRGILASAFHSTKSAQAPHL
jgi:uncharacterized protein with von Willebrand factor type A (vWA) domain